MFRSAYSQKQNVWELPPVYLFRNVGWQGDIPELPEHAYSIRASDEVQMECIHPTTNSIAGVD